LKIGDRMSDEPTYGTEHMSRIATADPSYEENLERARLGIATVALFRLETPEPGPGFFEHSARVAVISERIAAALAVPAPAREGLVQAACLHEVGMVAVPEDLVRRPAPLRDEELQRVRAQAMIGAELVRAMYDARIAELVANQYRDYSELVHDYECPELCQLAGILRVADVIDAVTCPRPYQDAMRVAEIVELLERGAGTRFHPGAVAAALGILREAGVPTHQPHLQGTDAD
jgi:HD-GYP domain-containing protein (c-di-GMP phosphodiesterase class II)